MRRASWWPALVGGVLAVGFAPRGEGAPGDLPERDMLELGRRLFAEPAASLGGRGACIDCHLPEHGFDDPRGRSHDDTTLTARRSQPLHDLDEGPGLHWDGSIPTLEAVIEQRVTGQATAGPRSTSNTRSRSSGGGWSRPARAKRAGRLDVHAIAELRAERFAELHAALGTDVVPVVRPPEQASVGARLVAERRYQDLFELAGVREPAEAERLVVRSIAAYVRSLASSELPVDQLARGGLAPLDDDARRGYHLFKGRAGCWQCHVLEPDGKGRAPLRDGRFANTGVAWRSHVVGMAERRLELSHVAMKAPVSRAAAGRAAVLRARLDLEQQALDAAARSGSGLVEAGAGTRNFKTPTLRDVARRTRFMHDGSFERLEDVVRWYASGCGDDPLRDPRLKRFDASEQDVADLVAFLRSLTGAVRAGLTPAPWRDRGERTRLTLVDAGGAPLAGVPVRLEPAGDLAWEGAGRGAVRRLTTDAHGRIEFPVGDTTHVRVVPEGVGSAHGGNVVPDVCREATLRYAVRGRLRLDVVCAEGATPPETLPLWRVAQEDGDSAHIFPPRRTGVPLEGVKEGTFVDGQPWVLKRVAIEARAPVGAPPGHGPELHATYEAARPSSWLTGLIVAPGERVARHVDVAPLR